MSFEKMMHRVETFHASPSWESMPLDAKEAFDDRALAARDWSQLSDADQALVRVGELEVATGNSRRLTNPADWGDHDAIDAAIDADDTEALDAALFTVGQGYGVREPWIDGDVDDEPTPVDVDPDAEGWVGL